VGDAIEHVGDLRDRGKVEFATELDQSRAAMGSNLGGQLLGDELVGGRSAEVR
jgi:hypothetical protein